MYNPLVTIIIPVYNGSNFLNQAIDAALAQTYENIEIIVVNDGSKDNGASEAIALSYGDKIRYFNKENGGVSSALNFALEHMNGEWFSWLSHDDLYYPNKIERQIEFINELLNEDPDINLDKTVLHSATESIDRDGNVIKTPNYSDVSEKEDTIDVIINNVFNYRLSGCSFLLPYSCYKNDGGFREDIRTVSDVEYWYRLMFNGYQFYCVKDILVRNRNHGKQVGKTKVSLFDEELANLHIDIADQLAASDEYNSRDNIERFYLGLVKRGISDAAEYTKRMYLYNRLGPEVNVKRVYYSLLGKGRNVARYVFRKIKVK